MKQQKVSNKARTGFTGMFNALKTVHPTKLLLQERVQIGLDIGAYAIKVVHIDKQANKPIVIKSMGYKRLAPVNQDKQRSKEEIHIAEALREVWKEKRLKAKRVRLVVSDAALFLRHITVPRVSEQELVRAIKWQAEKYIPYPIDETVVDFQIVGSSARQRSDQLDIVFVALPKQVVNKYVLALKEARLVPTVLDITPFAIARAFIETNIQEREKMVALIDIGFKSTFVIILKGESLQFIKNIDIGMGHILQALASHLHVSLADAEKITMLDNIFTAACTVNGGGEHGYWNIIKPPLERLAETINRCFAYCEAEALCEAIQKGVVYGGGASVPGLDTYLCEKLQITIEKGDPFKAITLPQQVDDAQRISKIAPCIMPALGAAIG